MKKIFLICFASILMLIMTTNLFAKVGIIEIDIIEVNFEFCSVDDSDDDDDDDDDGDYGPCRSGGYQ